MAPRKVLTIVERHEVVKLLESGKSSRQIAEQYNVGRTQIQGIGKRKAEVLEDYQNNVSADRKRLCRATNNDSTNTLCWEWFKDATSRRIPVTGPMLREKALQFATDLDSNTDFKASTGWLNSFTKRHNIVFGGMSGERGDVDGTVVNDWKDKLPELCEGYEAKDIFNIDETGLFYKDTAKHTFHVKGDDCAGGKRAKDRITVALCASMTGEKLKPLVIAKSKQPRCFNKVKPETLSVTYRFNKKAWMNSHLMEEWLKDVDRKMKRQGRQILLFLDNAPSHPHLTLDNVKLQFFPANTTSKLQPMDQGIIQATKLKYRKRQLKHLIGQMDGNAKTGTQLLKEIHVLNAIHWITAAWNEVEETTITKCFTRCGFLSDRTESDTVIEPDDDDDIDDDVPLQALKLSEELFGCPYKELVQLDCNLDTCDSEVRDWDKPAPELLTECSVDTRVDSDDDTDSVTQEENDTCSISEARACLQKLQVFAMQHDGGADILDRVLRLQDDITDMTVARCAKQSKIDDFFRK